MPANQAGRRSVINVHNADGNIYLIEFSHPDRNTERLALCRTDVSHGGQTYIGWPFQLYLPQDDKGVPKGSAILTNVTRRVWDWVGPLKYPFPQVNITRVLESDTETVQEDYVELDVRRVAGTLLTVEVNFGDESFATAPLPAARMQGAICPWLELIG